MTTWPWIESKINVALRRAGEDQEGKTMEGESRIYANAGMQKQQGWIEMRRYADADSETLFTVKCVSLVLGIRLQMVKQIPVLRIMIDKRGYYRKGDIVAWLAVDMAKPDSLIEALRDEHANTIKRLLKEPSRRYRSSADFLSPADAKAAKKASKANRMKPATLSEIARDPRIAWKLHLPDI
jgi:hypothetical protein